MHLRADIATYHQRSICFLADHSWSSLKGNEYQPRALWWMVVPALLASEPANFNAYLTAFWGVNLLLLAAHILLAERFGSSAAPWVMLIVAIASGPILLYPMNYQEHPRCC